MKKVMLIVAFLLALTPMVWAQGTVKAERPDTVEVILSGEVDVPGFYRSEEINAVLNRSGVNVGGAGGWIAAVAAAGYDTAANPTTQEQLDEESGDAAIVPLVVINLDAKLGKQVYAHVVLKTNRQGTSVDDDATYGIWANATSVVGNGNIDLPVKTAFIEVKQFLFEEITFKFGLQNLKYDLRGKGAFFMDLQNAELAWVTPVTEAWLFGSYYGPFDMTSGGTADNVGLARFCANPGGFIVNYTTKDEIFSLDVYGMTMMETLNQHFDEQVFGSGFSYIFPGSKEEAKKSYLHGIINDIQADQGVNKVWTIGLGVDYFWKNFEFYGEMYFQFGRWWDDSALPAMIPWIDASEDTIKQGAFAAYIGGKYTFVDTQAKPWIDFSFTYISGDDGDMDSKNTDFISYENNNATMIVEDSLLGLDVDSNYWKIMLDLGASFKLHEENDFTINLTWAWFDLVSEPDDLGLADAAVRNWDIDSNIGHEVDLKFTWAYSKQCTFGLNFGFLFSGDFFGGDPDDDGAGTDNDFDGGYCVEDDSMFMCVFDTNVKW